MTILKATKNNAKAILTPFEQGAGEGDWRRYQARVKGHGKVLSIGAAQTTNSSLVVGDVDVIEGDQLYLQEGLDTAVKPVTAGAVGSGTTSTLDILGDGSCIALYNLDGNTSDISSNYNGTWTGTEQYAQAIFGQGALFNGSSDISTSAVDVLAASFYLYVSSLTHQGVFYFNGVEVAIKYNMLGICISSNMKYQHPISSGSFYHVIATKNGDLYLGGVLGSTISNEAWSMGASNNVLIGRRSYGGFYLANGSIIDQARLFNRSTFTQGEVDTLNNEIPRAIDISSAGFTNAPTRAVLKAPSIDICLEDEARRCISTDYDVPITQAFNDTIVTSLPEFNSTTRDCLDAGDNIVLTVDGSPVTTEILTIDKSTPDQYTITFAAQPTPPTACTVPSRAVAQTNPTPVGDWDGDNMTLEYDAVLKQGRALEISVQGDNAHEVAQVNVDLYKEVI